MYIKLASNDPNLSWKLVKHPDNVFTKDVSELRKITGKFTSSSTFECYIDNDPMLFLEKFRNMNMANYLNILNRCVSPFNLVLMQETFNSAMHGKADKSLAIEEVTKPYLYIAAVGPIADFNAKMLKDVAQAAGLTVFFTPLDGESEAISELATFNLAGTLSVHGEDSLENFLNKLYILCFASTVHLDFMTTVKEDSKQDMIVRMCGEWIKNLEDKTYFIRKMGKYHRSIAKAFLEKFNLSVGEDFLDEGDQLFKDSLHEQRHKVIGQLLTGASNVLELGCGSGQLLFHVPKEIEYVGIDRDGIKIERAKRDKRHGIFLHGNILYPLVYEKHLQSDAIVLSEVIEHLDTMDRKMLIQMFRDFYLCERLIITTPNREYNVNYGFTEGQLRHKDHKIEYNVDELVNEVVEPLGDIGYVCFWYSLDGKLIDRDLARLEPSFVLDFIYVSAKERKFNYKRYNQIMDMFSGFYLPQSGVDVRATTIMKGYNSRQFESHQDIFYLGPTIAPTEFNVNYDSYLETPESAFNYFKSKDQWDYTVEKKYMGSRAYILAYRTQELADVMGHKLITINSRRGFEFFDANVEYQFADRTGTKEELEKLIHQEIFANNDNDFMILDCEVMPWILKAERLSTKEFELPGQVELLFCRLAGKDVTQAEKYLATLAQYTKQSPIEIRVFDLVAYGKITSRINKFGKTMYNYSDYMLGLTQDKFDVNAQIEDWFNGSVVKPVETYDYYLEYEIVEQWKKDCATGIEGIVIKPKHRAELLNNGFPIQQAIKVRGEDYLRMVYGIYYKSLQYFDVIKTRNIKRKRHAAIVQAELSFNILRAFLNQERIAQQRYVATFIALDNEAARMIDATL